MSRLSAIMESFGKIKQELSDFITEANTDVVELSMKNHDILVEVKQNVEKSWEIKEEIKQANRSIKQINKLIGGK